MQRKVSENFQNIIINVHGVGAVNNNAAVFRQLIKHELNACFVQERYFFGEPDADRFTGVHFVLMVEVRSSVVSSEYVENRENHTNADSLKQIGEQDSNDCYQKRKELFPSDFVHLFVKGYFGKFVSNEQKYRSKGCKRNFI